MKIVYPTGTLSQFYGRSPLPINLLYAGNAVGPHALTQRGIYTVPTNRAAVLNFISTFIERVTAAAPIGKWGAHVTITFGGGSNYPIKNWAWDNTTTFNRFDWVTGDIFLIAGDIVKLYTVDLSTGGTTNMDLFCNIIEYNP